MKSLILISLLSFSLLGDEVNGWNMLHESVNDGDINKTTQMCKIYDIDSTTKAGITPLHIAVKNRDLKMVIYLLDRGADIDVQDINGLTPLHYAIGQKRIKIVKYLVKRGADIESVNNYGITPLHQAAYSGRVEIVEFLLMNGADVFAKNDNNSTPYDLAKAKHRVGVSELLKAYMGEKRDEDNGKRTK